MAYEVPFPLSWATMNAPRPACVSLSVSDFNLQRLAENRCRLFLPAISAGIGQRFDSTGISTPAQKRTPRTGSCRVHAQRSAAPATPPPTVGETQWWLFGFAVGAAN